MTLTCFNVEVAYYALLYQLKRIVLFFLLKDLNNMYLSVILAPFFLL